MKFKLNAFISILITSLATSVLVGMPIEEIAATISGGFGSTLAGIGIVTGLGVMLSKFMFESGAIKTISDEILTGTIASSSVSPVICAIDICAGGMGLSLPDAPGFCDISRFFKISVTDTIRVWTIGGFVAGVSALAFVSILSLFQGVLPGLI